MYWTRKRAAREISAELFEISERSLGNWDDVPLAYLNGKAHGLAEDWLRAARKRLAEQLTPEH